MATKYEFFSGKAKWAHTTKPDKYDKYSIVLYLDQASLEKVRELKETKPPILNQLSKDEDGYYIKFSRPMSKVYNGKVKGFAPPEVLKPDGIPLTEALIGNGSDVTCKVEVYTYNTPGGGQGRATRLQSIRVDNLIPFEVKRDFTEEQEQTTRGLMEQPQPLF
jgi:hypothetical protein